MTMAFRKRAGVKGDSLQFHKDYIDANTVGGQPTGYIHLLALLSSLQAAIETGDDVWVRLGPDKSKSHIMVSVYEGRTAVGYASGTDIASLAESLEQLLD